MWTKYQTPSFDEYTTPSIEAVLMQLFSGVTSDGDLISKSDRTWLVEAGLATRYNGWNTITASGIQYLTEFGLIHS